MEEGLSFEDYRIQLDSESSIHKLELEIPYLASLEGISYLESEFQLHHDLFTNDVLLFKSNSPHFKGKLYSQKGNRSVTVLLNGIGALGVWTMPDDSPFVCFEPWDGYPDLANDFTQNLEEKRMSCESQTRHLINLQPVLFSSKRKDTKYLLSVFIFLFPRHWNFIFRSI